MHQFCIDSNNLVGGIDTWIKDYLFFAKKRVTVIGTYEKQKRILRNNCEYFGIQRSKARGFFPTSLLFALKVVRNRSKIRGSIYIHRIDYAVVTRLLKPKTEIVLFIHTDLSKNLGKSSESKWRLLGKFYYIFESISLKTPNKVFLYSETDYVRLKSKRPDCIILKSFYNDNVFRSQVKWSSRPKQVIWVGRFESPKNPLFALEVVRKFLHHDRTDIQFVFIGNGSQENKMKQYAVDNELTNLKLVSPLSANDLAKEMNKSRVIFTTSEFEGSPRVLYEAIGCNVALVTCQSADPDNLGLHNSYGIQVKSKNIDEYYDAIVKLISLRERNEITNPPNQGSQVVNEVF